MNANDHTVDVNISSFGICTIKTTLANGVPQQCKPMTILPWLMVNNKFLVDGAPALTTNSKLPCMCGGVISIIPDLPEAPSTPATSKAETSADEEEKMQTEKETVTVKNESGIEGAITGAGATTIAGASKVAKEGMDLAEEIIKEEADKSINSLSNLGYKLLCDIELLIKDSSKVRLDDNGNITHIKNHDVKDGGITVGVGIFVDDNNLERIAMLEDLGIRWDDTTQWVEMETINIAFNNISDYYISCVKRFEKKLIYY